MMRYFFNQQALGAPWCADLFLLTILVDFRIPHGNPFFTLEQLAAILQAVAKDVFMWILHVRFEYFGT